MDKGNIEQLVIEKLTQLENGELEKCITAKKLAEEFKKNPKFLKIYEDSKLNKK